jgi:hypothetical protein
VDRAKEVLVHLEAGRFDRVELSSRPHPKDQLELFTPALEEWRADLAQVDVDRLTPLDAFLLLDRWRKKYLGSDS